MSNEKNKLVCLAGYHRRYERCRRAAFTQAVLDNPFIDKGLAVCRGAVAQMLTPGWLGGVATLQFQSAGAALSPRGMIFAKTS